MSKDNLADRNYGNGIVGPSVRDYELATSTDDTHPSSWDNFLHHWKRPAIALTALTSVLSAEMVLAQQEIQVGNEVRVVSTSNIRRGPGINTVDIGDVSEGDVYSVTGESNGSDGSTWYEISDKNGTILGYIRRDKVEYFGRGSVPELTSIPEDAVAMAIENGELIATPDNVGYVMAGAFSEEPNLEYLKIIQDEIAAHPEMLLPSIEAGQNSTFTQDGQPVEYGLLSKSFMETITVNGFTKDVYKFRFVAKFRGSIEVPPADGFQGFLIMIYELKAKTGESFNIVSTTTTRHTTNPQDAFIRLGTMEANNADQLNEEDIPSSDRIIHTMENPGVVGQDVILEALNNDNPFYGLGSMQNEQTAYAEFESAIENGTPFSTHGGPNVWKVYVPENVVVA